MRRLIYPFQAGTRARQRQKIAKKSATGVDGEKTTPVKSRAGLLRELAANRESLVATHLSFPSVCHVAIDGDVFRWVPGPWEY